MTIETLESVLAQLPPALDGVHSSELAAGVPFMEIARGYARLPGTVLLMSGGDADCARYNILGIEPWLVVRTTLTKVTIESAGRCRTLDADPFQAFQRILQRYRLPPANHRYPIAAGMMGYLSYDLKDSLETLPRTCVDDVHLPHLYMVAPSLIIIEDRREKTVRVHIPVPAGDATGAAERLASFDAVIASLPASETGSPMKSTNMRSCFTRKEYVAAAEAVRDYIIRGHVYQVNMSQRFEATCSGDPFDLFTSLFAQNPAPFYTYINAGDHHIVSTSPERLVQMRDGAVEARPIKGTRRRGTTPEEDRRLRDELAGSSKDDAELSMIVDLLRNDLGKVCRAGSVSVPEHKRLETYDNVFHLVSIVKGMLDDGNDAVDCIRAVFPGGSITGCPKIRAMEIIDELEPVRRHLYTGSTGYVSFHETMDLSIAIRTATIKGDRLLFSVGGGVVYDSVAADEYEETLHKGQTFFDRFGRAPAGPALSGRVGWYNGRFMPIEEIGVPVDNEGFLYGYGIFETLRVNKGSPCRLPEHLERFEHSWNYCFDDAPPDITWDTVIRQVVERCGLADGVAAVKLLAAAGARTDGNKTLLVTARPYVHRLQQLGRSGLHLAVYPYPHHSPLSSHKTMNYMFGKMANIWAQQHAADEAVLVNADGSVCETVTANIFCRIGGAWYRPLSEYVLPGTMEKAVCDLLARWGVAVGRRVVSVDALKNAEAVFLTNALMGAVPVLRIDNQPLGGDDAGLCGRINAVALG